MSDPDTLNVWHEQRLVGQLVSMVLLGRTCSAFQRSDRRSDIRIQFWSVATFR